MDSASKQSLSIKRLIGGITAEFLPSEMKIFRQVGGQVLTLAAAGEDPRTALSTDSDGLRAEFGMSEVLQVVSFVSVAIGTYKAYLEIRKLKQSTAPAMDTPELWKQRLIAEGLDPELVQRVIDRFGMDFERLNESG